MFYEAEDYRGSNPEKSVAILDLILKESTFDASSMHCLHESFTAYLDDALESLDHVSRNEAVDGLTIMLDGLNSSQVSFCEGGRIELYERVLSRLNHMKTHRLWLNTSLQLARMYLQDGSPKYDSQLRSLIRDMQNSSQSSSYSLDIYALEILLLTRVWNGHLTIRALKPILQNCQLEGAVGNPGTIATIREATGKIYLYQAQYSEAYTELFEAFRSYSDSGHLRAPHVLQYAVIANILSLSTINPFDSREARAYLEDTGVRLIHDLRRLIYESNKMGTELLAAIAHYSTDSLVLAHLECIRHTIRLKFVTNVCKVYSAIALVKLAELLGTSVEETARLVMEVIVRSSSRSTQIYNGDVITTTDPTDELKEAMCIKEYALFVKEQAQSAQDRLNTEK